MNGLPLSNMAKKESDKKIRRSKEKNGGTIGTPTFPYSTKTKSLRKFLEMAPGRPKPPKITTDTLKVWGFRDANDASMLRVLKELQLLSPGGEPTDYYVAFMTQGTGPEALGQRIKIVYEKLFQNVTSPEKASNEELQNFFNIHSGGGEKTIKYQIETFKALADHASFNDAGADIKKSGSLTGKISSGSGFKQEPDIRVDLHIHLPEGGSKTDYESIIENIAKHLYGRDL